MAGLVLLPPWFPAGSAQTQTAPKAQMLKSPRDGGVRRWETAQAVLLRQGTSAGTHAAYTLEKHQILRNLGCSQTDGETWCQVRPLRGGVRGYVRAEQLNPAIGPDGKIPMGIDNSKRRASKKQFDARSSIRCAQEQGQPLGECSAAVARSDGGDATVTVKFSNGFSRNLYFVHGQFLRASATMSGVGTDMDWSLTKDHFLIRVDDQRYEIASSFVLGN